MINAYTVYVHYPQIKEILDQHHITEAKVFGFLNGDTDGIFNGLDLFIAKPNEDHGPSLRIEEALQELLFPQTPIVHTRLNLIDALFSPMGALRVWPDYRSKEAQEAYINEKIANAVDLTEMAARGKMIGAFAALICRELEACGLTYTEIKSEQYTPDQKTAMARIYLYFEALKDLPRHEGDGDFFRGLSNVCIRNARSRDEGMMYSDIAEHIIEIKEGEKYAQALGLTAKDIEDQFPLALQAEIHQIFARNPQAIARAMAEPIQHYAFTNTSFSAGSSNTQAQKQRVSANK